MRTWTILWVDLRTADFEPDLCSSLPPVYRTQRLRHFHNLLQAVQTWRPWAVCFEYDVPEAPGLAALLEVRARHSSLPIILLAEKHAIKRELAALRRCASDYLVKPVSVRRLCDCLTCLCEEPTGSEQPDHPIRDARPSVDVTEKESCLREALTPAVSYVATNYQDKVCLSTAAKLCHLSRFQFSRNFKKEQGLTFRDFVVQLRVRRAAELMRRARPLSVTEAAFVVGFNDLSHFSRMFRRQFGVLPSHYRRTDGEPIQLTLFPPDPSKH
jgi:AraC-like DNA-binding protein